MAKKTAIIYSSVDGQTKKISEFISAILQPTDSVKLIDINSAKGHDLASFNMIIIGASIRYGKYRTVLYDFIRQNKKILLNKKTAFFSVNVVARKKQKASPETNPYMIKFLEQSDWEPTHLGVFAGKIDYPSLGFFDRYIIKFIMWLTKGPTDTKGCYEFTDWESVKKFSHMINK